LSNCVIADLHWPVGDELRLVKSRSPTSGEKFYLSARSNVDDRRPGVKYEGPDGQANVGGCPGALDMHFYRPPQGANCAASPIHKVAHDRGTAADRFRPDY
jgi:hypothetical protein